MAGSIEPVAGVGTGDATAEGLGAAEAAAEAAGLAVEADGLPHAATNSTTNGADSFRKRVMGNIRGSNVPM